MNLTRKVIILGCKEVRDIETPKGYGYSSSSGSDGIRGSFADILDR